MPAGQPTKYKKKYCDEIVEYMAQGYSATAFAGKIGVCADTIQEWTNSHKEFSLARRKGVAAAEQYYITMGKGLMTGKVKGNSTPWIFMLKNICGWRDKQELDLKISENSDDHKMLRAVPREQLLLLAATKKDDKE